MTSRISHDASSVPIRTEGEGQSDQAQGVDLFVLDSVDGMSSVEELAMMLAMDEGEVLRILRHLSDLKLVRWEASDTSPSAAPEDESPWRDEDATITEEITIDEPDLDDDVAETFRFITAPATEFPPQDAEAAHAARNDAASDKHEQADSAQTDKVEHRPETAQIKAADIERPPPVPTTFPPPKDTHASRSEVVKTPRQHLDTSWWQSDGITQEPDELLTSREISHSGLRFAPKMPVEEESAPKVTVTSRDDIITDRIDPVSGGIDISDTVEELEETQQLSRPPRVPDTPPQRRTKRPADAGAQPVVDEVAHTRGGGAPLLPDIEYDDTWNTKGDKATPTPRTQSWSKEPISSELMADSGQWSVDEARCISYFVRLIEHGSYYDIFGVDQDADRETIAEAAQAIEQYIDFYSLDLRGSKVGKELLNKVRNGVKRALDVLQSSDSRAQYDAALEALAAFKLS